MRLNLNEQINRVKELIDPVLAEQKNIAGKLLKTLDRSELEAAIPKGLQKAAGKFNTVEEYLTHLENNGYTVPYNHMKIIQKLSPSIRSAFIKAINEETGKSVTKFLTYCRKGQFDKALELKSEFLNQYLDENSFKIICDQNGIDYNKLYSMPNYKASPAANAPATNPTPNNTNAPNNGTPNNGGNGQGNAPQSNTVNNATTSAGSKIINAEKAIEALKQSTKYSWKVLSWAWHHPKKTLLGIPFAVGLVQSVVNGALSEEGFMKGWFHSIQKEGLDVMATCPFLPDGLIAWAENNSKNLNQRLNPTTLINNFKSYLKSNDFDFLLADDISITIDKLNSSKNYKFIITYPVNNRYENSYVIFDPITKKYTWSDGTIISPNDPNSLRIKNRNGNGQPSASQGSSLNKEEIQKNVLAFMRSIGASEDDIKKSHYKLTSKNPLTFRVTYDGEQGEMIITSNDNGKTWQEKK